eukprot:9393671-Pyramimonas_sp.AAC.1
MFLGRSMHGMLTDSDMRATTRACALRLICCKGIVGLLILGHRTRARVALDARKERACRCQSGWDGAASYLERTSDGAQSFVAPPMGGGKIRMPL